VYSKSVK